LAIETDNNAVGLYDYKSMVRWSQIITGVECNRNRTPIKSQAHQDTSLFMSAKPFRQQRYEWVSGFPLNSKQVPMP